MWEDISRRAATDVGVNRDVLAAVDHLALVHCQSWAYDHPVDRLAERIGLEHTFRTESILAGTSPQRLIDEAAARMLRGEASVALVVGGEALATRKAMDRAGEVPVWSHPHPSPPSLPVDLDQWYLPTELAHGVLPAWLTFALLEQARWAALGGGSTVRRDLGAVVARLNAVATANPDAWFRESRSEAEIVTPGPDNRRIATPYTKRMTAFIDVDMAAANILVTKAVADAWSVPDEHRVYLRGWGFARDAVHIAARTSLSSSAGMRTATSEALGASGFHIDEIDVFDLYSCFGSAVQFARDALSIAPDDPRPISMTGGLPYHGGPSSNYVSHSISHVVDHLRAHPDQAGMTTGVGMHMTKHVAAVWSSRPGPLGVGIDHGDQRWDAEPSAGDRTVVDRADGEATIAAASVIDSSEGLPVKVVAICEFPSGDRCYATTDIPEVIDAVATDQWVGRSCELESTDTGTNTLRL